MDDSALCQADLADYWTVKHSSRHPEWIAGDAEKNFNACRFSVRTRRAAEQENAKRLRCVAVGRRSRAGIDPDQFGIPLNAGAWSGRPRPESPQVNGARGRNESTRYYELRRGGGKTRHVDQRYRKDPT